MPEQPGVFRLGGDTPSLADEVRMMPGAVVVGRVTLGRGCSVWYGAVLRGDDERIVLGEYCNVQDGCLLHADPGEPTLLGDRVTVGHGAVIHGAHIDEEVLVGIGAIVLDGARIGRGCKIAAGAVVPPGMEAPAGTLLTGVPARVRREVTEEERAAIVASAASYRTKAHHHATSTARIEPVDRRPDEPA